MNYGRVYCLQFLSKHKHDLQLGINTIRKDGFQRRKYNIFKDHLYTFYSYSFYVFLPLSYSANLDGGSGSYLMISVLEIQYCGIPDKGLGESGLGGGWALLSIRTIVRQGREGTLPQTLL